MDTRTGEIFPVLEHDPEDIKRRYDQALTGVKNDIIYGGDPDALDGDATSEYIIPLTGVEAAELKGKSLSERAKWAQGINREERRAMARGRVVGISGMAPLNGHGIKR